MKTIYELGWPIWPFTKLTEAQMAKLLREIKAKQLAEIEEALL